MLASTITSALALFAAAASAAPGAAVAAPAVDLAAVKTNYRWNMTGITSYSLAPHTTKSLDFTVAFSAQPNTTHCTTQFGGPGNNPGGRFDPCDNAAVTFTSDIGRTSVTISQLFVYNGVNIRVNGSAPLGQLNQGCYATRTLSEICSLNQLTVNVTSAAIVTSKKGN